MHLVHKRAIQQSQWENQQRYHKFPVESIYQLTSFHLWKYHTFEDSRIAKNAKVAHMWFQFCGKKVWGGRGTSVIFEILHWDDIMNELCVVNYIVE